MRQIMIGFPPFGVAVCVERAVWVLRDSERGRSIHRGSGHTADQLTIGIQKLSSALRQEW
jgi:hypothetical protein